MSPSSGGTYSVGPNRLELVSVSVSVVGSTLRRRENSVSGTSCFKIKGMTMDKSTIMIVTSVLIYHDRICDLVVRVPGYRSRGPGSIPGVTRFSEKWWVWNGCTQPREYN
jgi:hypothetical protein